ITVTKERRAAGAMAFTPNFDGNNDAFYIQADDKVRKVNVFRVYDRWGELVFETFDIEANKPELGWDGSFKGKPMNSGVYVWYAEIEFIDDEVQTIRGDVTLLR